MKRYLLNLGFLILCLGCASPEQKAVSKASDLITNEQLTEAGIYLKEAVKKYPKNPDLLYLTGWVLMSQGQDNAALEYFGKCLNLNPKFYGGHNGLGGLYLKQNKLQPAEREFNLAREAKPDMPEIYGNLAEVKSKLGQFQEAKDLLTKAAHLKSSAADYPYLLARNAARANQLEEAQQFLDQAERKKFLKKSFRIQFDCLKGVVASRVVEKSVQDAASKPLKSDQIKKLEEARENLLRCEKSDPQHFVEFEARGRIAALITQHHP